MAITAAKCTQCGAAIKVDAERDAGICPHCGTAFVTQKAIENYNITYSTTNIVHKTIIGKEKNEVDDYILRAEGLLSLGRLGEAKEQFTKAATCDPLDYRGWLGLIICDTSNATEVIDDNNGYLKSALQCLKSDCQKSDFVTKITPYFQLLKKEFSDLAKFFSFDDYLSVHPSFKESYERYRAQIDRLQAECDAAESEEFTLKRKYYALSVLKLKQKRELKEEIARCHARWGKLVDEIAENKEAYLEEFDYAVPEDFRKETGIDDFWDLRYACNYSPFCIETMRNVQKKAGELYVQYSNDIQRKKENLEKSINDYRRETGRISQMIAENKINSANVEIEQCQLKLDELVKIYQTLEALCEDKHWQSVRAQYRDLEPLFARS